MLRLEGVSQSVYVLMELISMRSRIQRIIYRRYPLGRWQQCTNVEPDNKACKPRSQEARILARDEAIVLGL